MATTTTASKYPFDLQDIAYDYSTLQDLFLGRLGLTHPQNYEARARISNIVLGRNHTAPTIADAMMAERMYQKGELDKFSYWVEWQENDDEDIWFKVQVVEREGNVPKAAAFGELLFNVEWQAGFRGAVTVFSSATRDIVSQFHGFTVFDDCQGFVSESCWPWAVRVTRDIQAWAGAEAAEFYDAFLTYAKALMGRYRDNGVLVKLKPEADDKVRLQVQIHRGTVQLAGFTTVAEFNEVFTKEKH